MKHLLVKLMPMHNFKRSSQYLPPIKKKVVGNILFIIKNHIILFEAQKIG